MPASAKPTLLLTGPHGQLASLLIPHLAPRFHILALSRSTSPIPNATLIPWDGTTLGPWAEHLNHAAALINLAGRSVNCRYTRRNRRDMLNSRILSTRILNQALAQTPNPPPVWLNAGTATIYKHSLTQPMDEPTGIIAATPEAKDAFSIQIATQWEHEFFTPSNPATRKIALRSAIVLANHPANMLTILRRLTRLGLGGTMATGNQFVSWIHALDFCRAIDFLLAHPTLQGPINLASPNPITNAHMMQLIRNLERRPFALPNPKWLLEIGAFFHRTETELIIKSRNVIPTRLLQAGFTFQFPTFEQALQNLAQPNDRPRNDSSTNSRHSPVSIAP